MSQPHFDKDFFTFFKELKANNNRDWFNENKAHYEASVAEPCLDFIAAMATPLQKISPHFDAIPKKVGGSMFRIYRDTRFSKDKTPYKTNAGLHFRHNRSKTNYAPGFYLHLAPGEVFMGAGIWGPDGPTLAKIRAHIDENQEDWLKVTNAKGIQDRFGGLREGNPLKRPPKGYSADHPLVDDLKKRSFFMMQDTNETAATHTDFLGQVTDTYKAAAPLVEFICDALDVPF